MACEIGTIICSLNFDVFIYALLGGVLPALLWLWFWLHEDAGHREPRSLIVLTFMVGMAMVLLAAPVEKLVIVVGRLFNPSFTEGMLMAVVIWAGVEEIFKYIAARLTAFKHVAFTRPIDAFIYITTASLGFSAMENTLFLLSPLLKGDTFAAVIGGSLRFMGASLLHFLASGVIALCVGLTFYASRAKKALGLLVGLIIAVALHTLFNFFIIGNEKQHTFLVFSSVWILVIFLTISIERVKTIKNF